MPLYEYECANDGRFEVIRKFSDPPLAACPTCGSPVQKQASAPAIQFKGSGWYITDYARKSSGEGSSKDKGEGTSKDKGDKSAPEKSASEKPSSKDSASPSSSTPTSTSSSSSASSDSK